MKVYQIVGEHAKGFRAKKYAVKPKAGPEPRKPIKPTGHEQEMGEDATITKSDANGVEIDNAGIKTVIPADKSSMLSPDKTNPNEYDLNPNAVAPSDGSAGSSGPKVGSKVDFTPTSESHGEIGGDPTDKFIYRITDHEFEKQAHEGMFGFGNKTAEEWAKTSPQMAKLLQFRAKYQGTQYADQVEKRIQLLKDRLDMDAGEVAGPDGNPKDPVAPDQFNKNDLKESDNALLEKMRTIAGLR